MLFHLFEIGNEDVSSVAILRGGKIDCELSFPFSVFIYFALLMEQYGCGKREKQHCNCFFINHINNLSSIIGSNS